MVSRKDAKALKEEFDVGEIKTRICFAYLMRVNPFLFIGRKFIEKAANNLGVYTRIIRGLFL
jgi:hypothetical protein